MTETLSTLDNLVWFGASVTGSQHQKDKRPNEDAWMGDRHKLGTFIVVSDGLGSKPNARQGAKTACIAVKQALRHWLAISSKDTNHDVSSKLLLRLIHVLWSLNILPNAETDSAATCLFATVSASGKLAIAQLGDGLAVLREPDGSLHSITSERSGFSNQTTGLGIAQSTKDWQILTRPSLEKGSAIFLATDGIADDLQRDRLSDFIAMLLSDFGTLPPRQRWQALSHELREFPVPNHLDDKTLAILWRRS